jgi:hypothetical protein
VSKRFKWIVDLLNENNVDYWLDSGTLLGLIRNGGPLPHDNDIDISIWDTGKPEFQRLLPKIREAGYRVRCELYRGIVYKYKLTPGKAGRFVIDVSVFRRHEDYAWCPAPVATPNPRRRGSLGYYALGALRQLALWYWDRLAVRADISHWPANIYYTIGTWYIPLSYLTDFTIFGDIRARVPSDWEAYLTFRYGDWREPVQNWNYWTDDGAVRQAPPSKTIGRLLKVFNQRTSPNNSSTANR